MASGKKTGGRKKGTLNKDLKQLRERSYETRVKRSIGYKLIKEFQFNIKANIMINYRPPEEGVNQKGIGIPLMLKSTTMKSISGYNTTKPARLRANKNLN